MFNTAIAEQVTVDLAVATSKGDLTVAQPDIKAQLTGIAQAIKVEMKRTVESVLKIGTLLLQAKELTANPKCGIEGRSPDNRFSEWIRVSNFETLTPTLRATFMNVARVYGDRAPSELDGIGLSILYELAAPSTPAETRAQIEASIASGNRLTVSDVKGAIRDARTPTTPNPPPSPAPQDEDEDEAVDESDDVPFDVDPPKPSTPAPSTSPVEDEEAEEERASVSIFSNKLDEESELRLQVARLININCENLTDLFVENFRKGTHPDYFVGVARASDCSRGWRPVSGQATAKVPATRARMAVQADWPCRRAVPVTER